MSDYIHLFETQAAHDAVYNGSEYTEPWVGLVTANNSVSYNSEYQKYKNMPLTFEILSDGIINWTTTSTTTTIQYKKNDGNWTDITSSSAGTSFNVVSGDIVQFKSSNTNAYYRYNSFDGTTAGFNVKGNIMSLFGDTSTFNNTGSYTTGSLFKNCTGLVSAEHFILPSLTLQQYCYSSMFYGCTSLIIPPELPATTLTKYCYESMFYRCTSLRYGPKLIATTLQQDCYSGMFWGCTSLTTAPDLPATTLVLNCYEYMFKDCTNLNSIKCLATTGTNNCRNWVNGVAASGTFTKAASITSWPTGVNGIPSGWTVQDAS